MMKNKVMGALILASLASPVLMAGDFNGQAVELEATQLDSITAAGPSAWASSTAIASDGGVAALGIASTSNAAGAGDYAVYAISAAVTSGGNTEAAVGTNADVVYGDSFGDDNFSIAFLVGFAP